MLAMGRTESVVCPIKALLPYLALWGKAPGLLFISESRALLTKAQFKALLSATLRKAGLDDSNTTQTAFRSKLLLL